MRVNKQHKKDFLYKYLMSCVKKSVPVKLNNFLSNKRNDYWKDFTFFDATNF